MIRVNLEAEMVCSQDGCETKLPITLALGVHGNFVPVAKNAEKWQIDILMSPNGQPGRVACRCPEHHQRVTPAAFIAPGPVAKQ